MKNNIQKLKTEFYKIQFRANIKISFYTAKEKYGKIQDKGTTFEMKEDDIEALFNKIII